MDIKTLMIGDWVMINPISYYQVEQIRMEFGELRIYLKGTEVFATENEIMPIPLTPEILEKNGFRITFEGELHKTYFQDIDGFAVEIKIDCIGFTKLSMSNGLGYKVVVECKHVHKLQQAMRIMGCDKTIEL